MTDARPEPAATRKDDDRDTAKPAGPEAERVAPPPDKDHRFRDWALI